MKKILILFIILLASFSNLYAGEKFDFKIDLAQTSYYLFEPIWAEVTLTNLSEESTELGWFCPVCKDNSLVFIVKNEKGEVFSYTGDVIHYSLGNYSPKLYQPNEYIYSLQNILECNGILKHTLKDVAWSFKYLPVGKYHVQAQHADLVSNEISFEIIDPVGQIQNQLDELKSIMYSKTDKDYKVTKSKLNDFAMKFPNSIYAEYALWKSSDYNTLVQKYPESGYNFLALWYLYENNKSDEDSFFKVYRENNPNSKLSKIANHYIKYLEGSR